MKRSVWLAMLDLARMRRTKVRRKPVGQYLVSYGVVAPVFAISRSTKIVIEGGEYLTPERPVLLAMNHTDRFNAFPLLCHLVRYEKTCSAAWVKGKYYENPMMAWFLEATNSIPLPSRGYVLVTEFRRLLKRVPRQSEYRVLRGLVDGEIEAASFDLDAVVADDTAEARAGLLRFFEAKGGVETFVASFRALFDEMVGEAVRLTREALYDCGLHVLVHPEGTRSAQLAAGRTGLVQVAQHLGAAIVPVGCNGTDLVFPRSLPWPAAGTITYRLGPPLEVDDPEIRAWRVPTEVRPLTHDANTRFADPYRKITAVLMRRLNAQLDPAYRVTTDDDAPVAQGANRFV